MAKMMGNGRSIPQCGYGCCRTWEAKGPKETFRRILRRRENNAWRKDEQ